MSQAGNIFQNPIPSFDRFPGAPVFAGKANRLEPPTSKNLGGANQDLAAWYENALPYWQAYQQGELKIPAGQAQQLAEWIQWAQSELSSSSNSWGDATFGSQDVAAGRKGPMGNATYTKDKNSLTVDGSVPISDVWGSEATLNVPPPCMVTFETTTDTRFHPPENVVRAVITNPAKRGAGGQVAESVVYFHDEVRITCNASKTGDGDSRVSDNTGTVAIGEYKDGMKKGGKSEASIAGEYDSETNTTTYDGTGQDAVKFSPQGSGRDGEISTNLCECNAEITVKNTDRVYAYQQDGKFVYDVVHKDGSVDRYVAGPEYSVNLNGIPEHIFIGSDAKHKGGSHPAENSEGDKMKMPPAFAQNLTINFLDSESSGEPITNGQYAFNGNLATS